MLVFDQHGARKKRGSTRQLAQMFGGMGVDIEVEGKMPLPPGVEDS